MFGYFLLYEDFFNFRISDRGSIIRLDKSYIVVMIVKLVLICIFGFSGVIISLKCFIYINNRVMMEI